jgi:AP-3 complex subunit beta
MGQEDSGRGSSQSLRVSSVAFNDTCKLTGRMDSSSLPQLIPFLQALLASPSPLTLGATLTAFTEICPDRLDLLHPYYRHICRLVVDADEWGQVVALDVLTRYARTMLEKPESQPSTTKRPAGEDSEDEFEGIDIDLAMLLHCSKPLFQSRNPAVTLAIATMYFHLAPVDHPSIGQKLLVAPLLRLASAPRDGQEITALVWEVIASIVEERPVCLTSVSKAFQKAYSRPFSRTTIPNSSSMLATLPSSRTQRSPRSSP